MLRTILLVAPLLVPMPAPATGFVVTHGASYESELVGAVPTGAYLAVFPTGGVFTDPATLTVSASCEAYWSMRVLPVFYASSTQVNTYIPNGLGNEPWGGCTYQGTLRVSVSTGSTVMTHDVRTVSVHPGGFFDAGGAPVGFHQNGTRLSSCAVGTCPLAVGGVPATITLFLSGAEGFVCASEAGCRGGIVFYLNGIPQVTLSVVAESPGVEVASVRLANVAGPGVYSVTFTSTAPQASWAGPLSVRLG